VKREAMGGPVLIVKNAAAAREITLLLLKLRTGTPLCSRRCRIHVHAGSFHSIGCRSTPPGIRGKVVGRGTKASVTNRVNFIFEVFQFILNKQVVVAHGPVKQHLDSISAELLRSSWSWCCDLPFVISVANRQYRRFIFSVHQSWFARNGCESPSRLAAAHKTLTCVSREGRAN